MPTDALNGLDPERLRRLIEVGRGLVTELRVEQVLDKVVETARELTGARYAALGILDADRRQLARFLTKGIDPELHRAIGDLPRGRGVLGVLIDDPRPLRLSDVTASPQSYGFPTGHPPMSTFLGVPVVIRGEAWGNLYLTEKEGGGDFDEADEQSVIVLADWAAIAIENARLYEALDHRRDELERAVRGFEATAAIATALGAETDLGRILELVVKRARALVGARSVLVLLQDGDALRVAAAAGRIEGGPELDHLPMADTRAGDVLAAGTALRVDDVDADERLDSGRLGVPDASTALLVPMVYRGRSLGVVCAFDRLAGEGRFGADDEQLLWAFAASAATAVATAKSVEAGRLRAALESAEEERRRWARELHDETLQALGGLKILLAGAARSDDPERLRSAASLAVVHVSQEIDNLRAIIAELRPASLDTLGLQPALETLAQRLGGAEGLEVEADVAVDGEGRLSAELETAIYRVAQEALTNVAKHAGAHRVQVTARREQGAVLLTITDDGGGFDAATPSTGFGLVGMRERVALVGGELEVETSASGTILRARFPVASAGLSPRPAG